MKHYSQAAVERTMKIQEVIMRAMAKKIKWYQAAHILAISCRPNETNEGTLGETRV